MKCPNDSSEMEQGTLIANGTRWQKGGTSKLYQVMFGNPGSHNIEAWRCPTCGEIKLKTGGSI